MSKQQTLEQCQSPIPIICPFYIKLQPEKVIRWFIVGKCQKLGVLLTRGICEQCPDYKMMNKKD